jgi:uncharacterized membrane protein YesL
MKAFSIIGRMFKAAYEELFLCVTISLLWWAGVVLIVTAGPATLGLHAAANRVANYRRSGSEFFWEEAKAFPGKAWALLAGILVLALLIVFNIRFYAMAEAGWMQVVAVIWVWVMLFFLLVAQYLFPLICQQSERSLRTALRNAGLLALRSPLYSLIGLLFQLLLIAICGLLFLPALILLPALLALTSNFMLTGLLQEMGLADPPPARPGPGE